MKKLKSVGAALMYFGIYFAIQIAVTMVFTIFISFALVVSSGAYDQALLVERLTEEVYKHSMTISLISNVIFIFVIWLSFYLRQKNLFAEVGIAKTKWHNFVAAIAIGAGLNVIFSVLLSIAPFPDEWWEAYNESSSVISDNVSIIAVIAVTILAPVAEELLFRGLVFTRFSKGLGIYAGAVLSAILFGLAHGEIIWAIYAGLLGLILVWVFVRTRSLVCSMLAHLAFNSTSYLLGDEINVIEIVVSVVLVALSVFVLLSVNKNELKGDNTNEQLS